MVPAGDEPSIESVSYPSTFGRVLPLTNPVPANIQWDGLVITTSESMTCETPLYWTPTSADSGLMFLHRVVTKRASAG